jgi:hypothetical protein
MPASPHPRRHYWSLPEAIAWRRRWQPVCSNQQAISELWDLLAGTAEVIAIVEGPNPLWLDARKADFERNNLGARVIIPKTLLAELHLVLEVDPRTGTLAAGFVEWIGSGIAAFSDPRFDRDKLIVAWRALLKERRAAPPEPLTYEEHIAKNATPGRTGPRLTWAQDLIWAAAQNPPAGKRELQRIRKKHGTAQRGAPIKSPNAG